jgi:hypothetical protein
MKRTKDLHKQIKIFLLIISVVIILFSQTLYAQALHFIAYGDTRRDMKTMEKPQAKHHAIARVIRELNPDFILFSGDMIYYNEFERFLEVITSNYTGDKRIPLYPVIGNHELIFGEKIDTLIKDLLKKIGDVNKHEEQLSPHTGLSHEIEILRGQLYKEINSIIEAKAKKRSRQVLCEEICDKLDPAYISYLKEILCKTTNGQSWYSFFKEAHGLKIKFIALNSSLPDDEEQYQWFLGELKQFGGPKIVFAHYPPYSIGHHGCTDMLNGESKASRFRDRYTKVFNNTSNNIVLVISGHEHNYQRICKTDKTGGIQLPTYIISGGGGADLTGEGECNVSQIPLDGFHCIGLIPAHHFLDVTAHTDDNNNLILKCEALGLRYDPTGEIPDDDSFEKHFVKDRLELIDNFTLNWQKQCN